MIVRVRGSRRRRRVALGLAVVGTLALAGCSDDAASPASTQSTATVTVTSSAAAPDTGSPSDDGSTDDRDPLQPVATDDPGTRVPQQPTTRPAADLAEGDFLSFASPTGKIQCRAVDSVFVCQTEGSPHTVDPTVLCGSYPGAEQGRAVRFGWLTPGASPCATIIQGEGYHSPHTLAYGQSVTFPPVAGRTITCSSASAGLTCTQVGGPGATEFFLSATGFRLL